MKQKKHAMNKAWYDKTNNRISDKKLRANSKKICFKFSFEYVHTVCHPQVPQQATPHAGAITKSSLTVWVLD